MWWMLALALAAPTVGHWDDGGIPRRFVAETHGEGPVWIFVEGDGSRRQPYRAWLWEETVGIPIAGTVVRPVTVANEGSRRRWRETTLADRVEDVRAVMDAVSVDHSGPIVLLGHSAGADVSVRVARVDERVAGVVSLGGGVHPVDVVALASGAPEEAIDDWRRAVEDADLHDRMGRRTGAFWKELMDPGQPAWWAGLPVPFLVLYGEDDGVVPASLAPRAADELAGSLGTVVVVPGVDHDMVAARDTWGAVEAWWTGLQE